MTGGAVATTPDVALFDSLCEVVAASMERLAVPGVALGVLDQGKEHIAGFGVTSVDNPLPVDADTLFLIGSTTKTVTATAAMRLVEAGRLDLDAPIRTYLPDLRLASEDVAARVTMRHLLTHTAGWFGDCFDDHGAGDDALARYVAGMAHLSQIMPLGEAFSYNNAGFILAGRVIEVLAGRPYEAAIQEMVLRPLGMTRSFFFAEDAITRRVAVGHTVVDNQPRVARPWAAPRASNPAGGISSSVRDQLRYARFHLSDRSAAEGNRLLSQQWMALMQTPQAPTGGRFDAVGLSWMLRDIAGMRVVSHGGESNGQITAFTLVPERQFAYTILTNSNRGGALIGEVSSWIFQHYLNLEPPPDAVLLERSEAELSQYVGRYSSPNRVLDLSVVDGALTLQVTGRFLLADDESQPPPLPPVRLGFLDPDRFMFLDEPFRGDRGEFLRRSDGEILGIRASGRIRLRET